MNRVSPAGRLGRGSALALIVVFFLSGVSGLAYEVLWLRQLNLIFGVTTIAVSTVLAAFMGGLALGSYYFGIIADRTRRPLLLYAVLEIGIGIYALLIVYLFNGLDQLYIFLGKNTEFHSLVLHLFRVAGAFVIILIPTTFMGGTLPLVSKFFVRTRAEIGWKTGILYGINTLGATAGTVLTGFFLIKAYGVQGATFLAAGVNFIVAAGAWWIARQSVTGTIPVDEPEHKSSTVKSDHEPGETNPLIPKLVLLAFGLSGFASLAYEVLWTRSLIYFLGLTTYSFTTMLAAFLVGLALGSTIISRFVDRFENPLVWFGVLEFAIGLFALVLMPLIHSLYPFSQTLSEIIGEGSWWSVMGVRFLIAFTIMLMPTLCMGATMPLIIRYFTRNLTVLGTSIGKVYFVNTLGSILGSLAAGFLLIPLFGVRLAISIVVVLNLCIAAGIFILNPVPGRQRRFLPAGISVLALIAVILLADNRPMILSSVEFQGHQKRYDLLYVSENPEASLAVLEDKVTNERELNINGESTAFTIYQDMQVHKLLGHLPALFHPAPRDFLVVGFGFGSSAYASTLYPESQVDCVELIADEMETADYFLEQNHGVLEFPNMDMIIGDGRDYIKLTEKRYDIISFNAIHPKISPNLYTYDFYKMCRTLLKDEGMVIAWMPPNAITEYEYRSLVNTFASVFPHNSFWYVNPSHMLILGSMEPLSIDMTRLQTRLRDERIHADLAETNLADPAELLSYFVAADEKLMEYIGGTELNTDNHPLIEFSRVQSVTVNGQVIRSIERLKDNLSPYLTNFPGDTGRVEFLEDLEKHHRAKKIVMEGQMLAWSGQYSEAEALFRQALSINPGNENIRFLLSWVQGKPDELRKLVQLNPENAKAIKGLGDIYLQEQRIDVAQRLFQRAVSLEPDYAEALHGLGVTYYHSNRLDRALEYFLRAGELKAGYAAPHFYAGQCYWRMGNAESALRQFQLATEYDPSIPQNSYWLGMAYARTGQTAKARDAFRHVLEINPGYQPALRALQQLSR